MEIKKYAVNEIFYTLQGEGIRAGCPSVFLRFAGCNLKCKMEAGEKSIGGFDCDTEFESSVKLSADEIVAEILKINNGCEWIVATGGEPALQLDEPLIKKLKENNIKISIETNGSINLDHLDIDWVCVSPKVAEHCVRQLKAHELKYVRNYGQGIPKPSCVGEYLIISPGFDGENSNLKNIEWCIKLVKENPKWRLSIQQHKGLKIR